MLNTSQAQQLAMALSNGPGGLSASSAATLAALQQHMQQSAAAAQHMQQQQQLPAAAHQTAPASSTPLSQAAAAAAAAWQQPADASGSGDLGEVGNVVIILQYCIRVQSWVMTHKNIRAR